MKAFNTMTIKQASLLTSKYIDCDYFFCTDGTVGVYTSTGVVKIAR